jgi:formate dehydrogenase major subunit
MEARVLVTDRILPLELSSMALDPKVHIQEFRAMSGGIRRGRPPRGPARSELVEEYIRRAGISGSTGMEVRGGE